MNIDVNTGELYPLRLAPVITDNFLIDICRACAVSMVNAVLSPK